jgi:hypothetical protein
MVWSRKLPKPIYLNDGRTIGTLAAARDFMLEIPPGRRASPHGGTPPKFCSRRPIAVATRRSKTLADAWRALSRSRVSPNRRRLQKWIASSSGSNTTLSCSLGSVREMTATQGSVWLRL